MTRASRPLTAWRRLAVPLCAAALLAPRLAAADSCTTLSFGPQTSGSTALNTVPQAVAVGDFNRDGWLDVVVANGVTSTINVLYGNGSGGFGGPAEAASVPGPTDVAVGDLDRDGRLDVVVASGSTTQAAVHQGFAGTTWATGSSVSVTVKQRRILLADLTRDGRLDLVVVSDDADRVLVFPGLGNRSFGSAVADFSLPGKDPSAAAAGDFDRDGDLDLAVALKATDEVQVLLNGGGGSLTAGPVYTVGDAPADVVTADLDRDGWLDLLTANGAAGSVSVLEGDAGTAFTARDTVTVLGQPSRLTVVDLDRDGELDLAVLDEATSARLVALKGTAKFPSAFEGTSYPLSLGPTAPKGLATGDFTSEGRLDLVTVRSSSPSNSVLVFRNDSGSTCSLPSFGDAPRSYPAGDGPQAAAAVTLDGDGRPDLVVASNGSAISVLLSAPGGYGPPQSYPVSPAARGLATADFDLDGDADVVAALGDAGSGEVRLLRGDGTGVLDTGGAPVSVGLNLSAVVTGDFDGNGAPDVAVASEGTDQVFVLPGNGAGGFAAPVATSLGAGCAPRALVAGLLDTGGRLDLAVACPGTDSVRILLGNGDGSFAVGSSPAVGVDPVSIAAGHVDAGGTLDLVTADWGSSRVSVLKGNGDGTFAAAQPYSVDSFPTGVALVQVGGVSTAPDIVVSSTGLHAVSILFDDGAGGFELPGPGAVHPVRLSPQAVVPLDADADGLLDVAVPCRTSDAVVVLLARSANLVAAQRVPVGDEPRGAASGDLDGDGDLDLAVANSVGNSVSVRYYDVALGAFGPTGPNLAAPAGPTAVVAADLDRDGVLDLAATQSTGDKVSVWRGPTYATRQEFYAGSYGDDLAAADLDRDGDLDLVVSNRFPSGNGTVTLLRNVSTTGTIGFADPLAPDPDEVFTVGERPEAVFVADFNRDGRLDLAVANDAVSAADSVSVLFGDGSGLFPSSATLGLDVGDNPLSVTGADFDGDGDVDLAAGLFGDDTVAVFEWDGAGFLASPDRVAAPDITTFAAASDLNRDGNVDLAAAAISLRVLRGRGSLALADPFHPAEDFLAGFSPVFVVAADWNRDGWPDLAVVNRISDDVSILMSTACQARRLEVTVEPAACVAAPPYLLSAEVAALDDAGSLATCAVGTVTPSLLGGDPPASLVSPSPQPLTNGVATFPSLEVASPGRRYRLGFLSSLAEVPKVLSRSFTLGPALAIVGPDEFCSSATYTTGASWDEYAWKLDLAPRTFTPGLFLDVVADGLAPGLHRIDVSTRIDGCSDNETRLVNAGSWASTTITPSGPVVVCVDCVGGTLAAQENGGGAVTSRQWGYRTASGATGTEIPIPGETAPTYVIKGTDFPGPGQYWVVVTSRTTCPSSFVVSEEELVTVSAVVDGGEVQYLAVTARGNGSTGSNRLQWVNSTGTADEICVRWNAASGPGTTCAFPLAPDCPSSGTDGPGWHRILGPGAGATAFWDHAGLALDTDLCYAVFVHQTSPTTQWSPGRLVKARPFDASGSAKWAYSTGATAVVAPSVGKFGVVALSNDRTVHSVERGGTGGVWPAGWTPQALGGLVHTRSAIVPFGSGLVTVGAKSVLLVGDDQGWLQAVDTSTGQRLWGTAPDFFGVDPSAGTARITGAPGAILQQYGGPQDLVLVGSSNKTAATASQFFALNPSDGSTAGSPSTNGVFDGSGTLGPVLGSPAIDYATGRVYFVSRQLSSGKPTVWCLQVTASAAAPFASCGGGWTNQDRGSFDTSPTLRNGRLYVANDVVYSLDAATGGGARTFTPSDGPVKGFVFTDRDGDDLFFATTNRVWSVSDDGSSVMPKNWEWTQAGLNPSLVLFWRERGYLYVGGANGTLWQLSNLGSATPTATPLVLGDGKGRIGAPSLDVGVVPPAVSAADKKLLVVGSEAGVLYGVEVPF